MTERWSFVGFTTQISVYVLEGTREETDKKSACMKIER